MVNSRRVDQYVTELAADHTTPLLFYEASSSMVKLVAIKQRTEQRKASSSAIPIENEVGWIYPPFQG